MKKLHDVRTEYGEKTLSVNDAHLNPANQFAVWSNEIEKLGISDFNAATLATYDAKRQRVRSRIILIKEITPEGIIFFSNYQSDKGHEIFSHPQVSVTIYWPALFRQVRLEGTVTKTSEKISEDYFMSRPRESQISAIISNQSKPVENRLELEKKYDELCASTELLVRPTYWGGLEVKADYWEFWQGRNHRLHDRICYEKVMASNTWLKKILAP